MKNWSTDPAKFTSPHKKRVWELTQLLTYGLDGAVLNRQELIDFWPELTPHLDAETRRLWEFWLWHRVYSLGSTNKFWEPLPEKLK